VGRIGSDMSILCGHTSKRWANGECPECVYAKRKTPEGRARRAKSERERRQARPENARAYDIERYKNPARKLSKRLAENERRKRPDVKAARRAEWMAWRASRIKRTPAWANLDAIKLVYLVAEQRTRLSGVPHHVDHFYPLNGKTVSGLHTSLNLRVIPARENLLKGSQLVN
jgi:hypothetical protein